MDGARRQQKRNDRRNIYVGIRTLSNLKAANDDMNFEKSQGLDLLPGRVPTPQEAGRDRELYTRLRGQIEEYPEAEQRAILWTIALQNAFEEQQIARQIPGLEMVTYGFAD